MQHIPSIAESGLPQLTKSEFYTAMRHGDLLFCSGNVAISRAIEQETGSCISHVLKIWSPGNWATEWLTLEATAERGVHVGRVADYVDAYPGDILLARRPALTLSQIDAELIAGLALLDDTYDWQQEVTYAAHKLLHCLPVAHPKNELYCSGLIWAMSKATPLPIQQPDPELTPSPEQVFTDPSVSGVGWRKEV